MSQIVRYARRKLRFEYQYGILASVNGSLRTPDNKGYYVRPQLSTGEYASPVRLQLAENAILKPYEGMAVKLIVDQTGQLVISGPNLAAIINQGLSPLTQNPGDSGAWGLINGEQLGPLYCTAHPTTPWAVRVYPGITQFGSTAVTYAGGDLTGLDSNQPASGNHCYVGVFLTPAGALEASASTAQATSSALGITDIQECIDGATRGSLFLRAYVVTGDDTDLTQSTSIDRRSLWSVGAGDFIDLLDVPSAYTDKASHVIGVAGGEDQLVFLDTRRYLTAYNYNFASNYRIGVAFGVDERNMLVVSEPAITLGSGGTWDDEHVKDPFVVRGPLGVLYMYYAGSDDNASALYKIGLARSYDGGLSWTKYASNPVLSPEGAGWETTGGASVNFPAVIYDTSEVDANKRWKMWYAGGKFGGGGVGYAYSADGITWTKYGSNPVLALGAGGQWDDTYIQTGSVQKLQNTYYMFFNGNNGSGTWQGGLATFTNPEGTYTKNASNPVLASDGITTTLTSSVAIGATALAVTDATVFPVGAPVWVYDASNHYIAHVKKVVSSTSLELDQAAPVAVSSTGGNVRSAAYNSVIFRGSVYDDGWLLGVTAFQPISGDSNLKEVSMVAYSQDLTTITIDYGAGLLIPITALESSVSNVSRENPAILKIKESDNRQDRLGITQEEGDTRYTLQSLFDANTILAANTDNTPSAVTVAEDRILGRKAGGNIAALTGAEASAIIGVSGVAAYEDNSSVVAAADKFDFKDAFDVVDAGSNDASIYLKLHDYTGGRLTLESGVPVSTSDQTAKTTVYYTPYTSNLISLYDGTRWRPYTFTERSASVPATTNTPFDVFIYDNAGTITLEMVNWTNGTTRATALARQDGRLVKSGATTKRYLGTGRTTGTSGQCEDSVIKRFLWNNDNRVLRPFFKQSTATTWTYGTSTWRQANADTAYQVECVVGMGEDALYLVLLGALQNNSAGPYGMVAIGEDSTSTPKSDGQQYQGGGVGDGWYVFNALLSTIPAAGAHYYAWLEWASDTVTFVGGTTAYRAGLVGFIKG